MKVPFGKGGPGCGRRLGNAIIHKDEVRANWDLIQNGEAHFKINPLQ